MTQERNVRVKYGPFPSTEEEVSRARSFAERAKALGFAATVFNDFERGEVFAVALRTEPVDANDSTGDSHAMP